MMDDLRNHDTKPTAEEHAWMSVDPVAVVTRLIVLAILAVAVGLSATQIAAPSHYDTVIATQH
jgi:hypothetical protein